MKSWHHFQVLPRKEGSSDGITQHLQKRQKMLVVDTLQIGRLRLQFGLCIQSHQHLLLPICNVHVFPPDEKEIAWHNSERPLFGTLPSVPPSKEGAKRECGKKWLLRFGLSGFLTKWQPPPSWLGHSEHPPMWCSEGHLGHPALCAPCYLHHWIYKLGFRTAGRHSAWRRVPTAVFICLPLCGCTRTGKGRMRNVALLILTQHGFVLFNSLLSSIQWLMPKGELCEQARGKCM